MPRSVLRDLTGQRFGNTRASVVMFDSVQEILGRFEHGETKASIGHRLGIDPSYVGALVNGKAWAEIDRPYLKKV